MSISHPLNAPFLYITAACCEQMSCLIAHYGVFAANERLVFTPRVFGWSAIDVGVGCQSAGSRFHYLALDSSSRHRDINDIPVCHGVQHMLSSVGTRGPVAPWPPLSQRSRNAEDFYVLSQLFFLWVLAFSFISCRVMRGSVGRRFKLNQVVKDNSTTPGVSKACLVGSQHLNRERLSTSRFGAQIREHTSIKSAYQQREKSNPISLCCLTDTFIFSHRRCSVCSQGISNFRRSNMPKIYCPSKLK